MAKKAAAKKAVDAIVHTDDKRKNIPSAEDVPLVADAQKAPIQVAFARRNPDLDPQLVWRGKDVVHWSDLVVHAPPVYIQEKVRPQAIIADLLRDTARRQQSEDAEELGLFADHFAHDFNGLPANAERTDFYQYEGNWANRMILGDSLQVMASLIEREGLRGKVQCIYFDPPYGIKFNSNFQWSTTSRDVKDGNAAHITREPEQVKAFRDTWRDGIHSYLTYLRDRLTVAKDLLTESGSIFVQIGDENVHRVRAVLDEVFGDENYITEILIRTTAMAGGDFIGGTVSYVLYYAKSKQKVKYRPLFTESGLDQDVGNRYTRVQDEKHIRRSMNDEERKGKPDAIAKVKPYRHSPLSSQSGGATTNYAYDYEGITFRLGKGYWKTNQAGMDRLGKSWRLGYPTRHSLAYVRFVDDFPVAPLGEFWNAQSGAFTDEKVYVVQTNRKVVDRCILMATDPGDLVLDPTCGSGTTAYVAEQWGRRWITIDTSRVALALARARLMGGRFPYYLLADSPEGQVKEADVTRTMPSSRPTYRNIKHGFVYERVPHITLKSIANNAEIDVIWDRFEQKLKTIRGQLSVSSGQKKTLEEWDIPRDCPAGWDNKLHAEFWKLRIARQKEIDASIAAKAEFEYLYDKPYPDAKKVRVSGPFTVESLSPHRMLAVGADDELLDPMRRQTAEVKSFDTLILEQLRTAGVQQAHKEGRIQFTSLTAWPGKYICGEGRYLEMGEEGRKGEAGSGKSEKNEVKGENDRGHPSPFPLQTSDSLHSSERRAGVFVGPEFGTVQRADLVAAAREAAEAGFDVVVACAFNYEAHATEFDKLGKIPVLKARMNADLHMAEDLKATGKGNLFVVFGEPDIEVLKADGGRVRVKVKGVDVFKPQTGEVVSSNTDGIACWFVDTDYNGESFFVRQAYFLGQADPYGALRTTLKAEVDAEAWATLNSDTSRPFAKPKGGQIAVKVINHLGDEVMKVFRV